MRTVDLIHRKRDGEELSPEEIIYLVDGYTRNEIPDYQLSAFLMAVFYSGMSDREVSALTESMLRSGSTLDLSGIPGMKVDKHSTGGVGDKTSLICAPLAAAAGIVVPMISGTRAGAHRRHAGQTGSHSGVPNGSLDGGVPRSTGAA
jgi:pyrimidine-nucleoside phosphorylase